MNTVSTSREAILDKTRELIRQRGWSDLTMRTVAKACGVAVGTLYTHFASKADWLGATVESLWCEIVRMPEHGEVVGDIRAFIVWLYERLDEGRKMYPDFYAQHALLFLGDDLRLGTARMHGQWRRLHETLCDVLRHDDKVRPDAFSERLTREAFADVLVSLCLASVLRQDFNPRSVVEIIQQSLY